MANTKKTSVCLTRVEAPEATQSPLGLTTAKVSHAAGGEWLKVAGTTADTMTVITKANCSFHRKMEEEAEALRFSAQEKAKANKKSMLINLSTKTGVLHHLNWKLLEVDPDFNPRDMNTTRMQDENDTLAKSIATKGVEEPLRAYVKKVDGVDRIFVTNGHRRLHCVAMAVDQHGAQIETVPVVMESASFTDRDRILTPIISNSSVPLTPHETAITLSRAIEKGYSTTELSDSTGYTISRIAQLLDLLTMPENVQEAVELNILSEYQARTLKSKVAATLSVAESGPKSGTAKEETNAAMSLIVEEALTQAEKEGKAKVKPSMIDRGLEKLKTSKNKSKASSSSFSSSSSAVEGQCKGKADATRATTFAERMSELDEQQKKPTSPVAKAPEQTKNAVPTTPSTPTPTLKLKGLAGIKEILLNATAVFYSDKAEVTMSLEHWYQVGEILNLPEPNPESNQKYPKTLADISPNGVTSLWQHSV